MLRTTVRSCFSAATLLSLATVVGAARPVSAQEIAGPPPSSGAKLAEAAPKVVEGVSTLKFAGHRDWTSTELKLRKGDLVRVRAWGRVRVAGAGNQLTDPAGLEAAKVPTLLDTAPACRLIAVVGDDNNDYISVGKESEFRAPHDGVLYLTLNQVDPVGNSGDFDVRVSVGAASGLSFGGPSSGPVASVPPPPTASGAPAQTSASPDEKTVTVQPRLDWTNCYITVNRGDTVVVEASGSVTLDLAGHAAGPDGLALADPGRLLTDRPTGALIAVVGVDNNDFIYLGSKGRFVSQRTGLLFLGVNEENLANNAGGFTARVRIERAAKP